MFQMPMSSPMITRMFGLGCARAGTAASAMTVTSANRTSDVFRLHFIRRLLDIVMVWPLVGLIHSLVRISAPSPSRGNRPLGLPRDRVHVFRCHVHVHTPSPRA